MLALAAQARHCYTRYNEYHRCVAQKGEDDPECSVFQRAYRSICPSDWLERCAAPHLCCLGSLHKHLVVLRYLFLLDC